MADLDDFFAKKDRKKAKGKKYVTTDDLAKRLEESGRKSEKPKDKKLSQNAEAGDERRPEAKDEEEWKEFEEEKKDYSNLKIQNLNINEGGSGEDGQDDEEEGEGELEENEVGEMVPKRKVPTGPWKVIAPVEEPEPVRQEKPPEHFGSGGGSIVRGSYVPPHQRNQTVLQHQPGSRLRSKQAPDINNEAYFPTLNAAKNPIPETGAWSRRVETKKREENSGFEEVRSSRSHSARYEPPKISSSSQGPKPLTLGNKYEVLRQDQS